MFAAVAFICFLLALLKADFGVDLLVLGLLFIALHMIFDFTPWRGRIRRG